MKFRAVFTRSNSNGATAKTLFFCHRVFYQPNNCHDDGSAHSTTRDTADDTLQIGTSSSGHANSQSLKDARTGAATDDARYGVAYRAQTIFLHRRAGDIATNGAAD
jgi:hypothetical protein